SGPNQTRNAKDFTAPQFETHRLKLAFTSQALDFQNGFTNLRSSGTGSQLRSIDLTSGHVADHLVFIGLARVKLRDIGSVTKHGNAVPVFQDLVETVGDVKDGSATF